MATDTSPGVVAQIPYNSSQHIAPNSNGKSQGVAYGNMCMVCQDVAQGSTVFRRHYGVVCCEACKCFFRRTVQMGREYKCRFSNACPVGRSAINMKQVCQACRFNECIKSGMKVECEPTCACQWVLVSVCSWAWFILFGAHFVILLALAS